MEEIWKNIPNYEGLYQISDCGRIKTLEKLVKSGLKNNSFVKRKERIIKNQINKLGYHHVRILMFINWLLKFLLIRTLLNICQMKIKIVLI